MTISDREVKEMFDSIGNPDSEYNNEFVVNVSCSKCKEWVTMRPKTDDIDSFTCSCGRMVKTWHMGTKMLKE